MRTAILLIITCLLVSCKSPYTEDIEVTFLKIKWHKSYEEDSIDKAVIGLEWALSYVGANTPCNASKNMQISENTITLHAQNIGFSHAANKVFEKLILKIKKTEAYRKNKTIDLGRFITLLLASPEHYYALIETPKTLKQLKENYTLNTQKGYINNSSVGLQDRVIYFSEASEFNQLWISEEIDSITKIIYEFETIELLKNGQLRFGIYDQKGIRKNVADKKHTRAGKPGKCIWCHESNLNQLFRDQKDVNGFLTSEALQQKIIASRDTFHANKKQLKYNIDYSKKQQHTLTELLYISFLEPSSQRLSLEWQMEEWEVKKKLKGLKTHQHHEFPFLGDLYHRIDVAPFSPLKAIEISGDVREQSTQEVNHLISDK